MRESAARVGALGTVMLVAGALVVFAALQQRHASESVADRLPRGDTVSLGREVYDEQRCARCHSIAGAGSPRSPLDGVGARLTQEEIRGWILAPRERDPEVRKPSYDLSAAELQALVAYLAGLRDPEG